MIFKDNKYTRIYYQLVGRRKTDKLSKEDVYCESHHIIPKSLGGNNEPDNLVNLLPREHFLAHLLLTKMVVNQEDAIKMNWALHKMCYSSVDYFNSKDYEWYRRRHSQFLKENHHSKRTPGWNQKMRELVTSNWENNDERRLKTSQHFKQWQHDNREKFLENNRKNATLGGQAAKLIVANRIEYKGEIYIGWKELKDLTGVSKFLYNRFYMKGFDPEDRIGKDGPVPRDYVYKPLIDKENQ